MGWELSVLCKWKDFIWNICKQVFLTILIKKKSQMYQYNITDIVLAFLMKELSLLWLFIDQPNTNT